MLTLLYSTENNQLNIFKNGSSIDRSSRQSIIKFLFNFYLLKLIFIYEMVNGGCVGGVPDGGGRPVELVPLVDHGKLRTHQAPARAP